MKAMRSVFLSLVMSATLVSAAMPAGLAGDGLDDDVTEITATAEDEPEAVEPQEQADDATLDATLPGAQADGLDAQFVMEPQGGDAIAAAPLEPLSDEVDEPASLEPQEDDADDIAAEAPKIAWVYPSEGTEPGTIEILSIVDDSPNVPVTSYRIYYSITPITADSDYQDFPTTDRRVVLTLPVVLGEYYYIRVVVANEYGSDVEDLKVSDMVSQRWLITIISVNRGGEVTNKVMRQGVYDGEDFVFSPFVIWNWQVYLWWEHEGVRQGSEGVYIPKVTANQTVYLVYGNDVNMDGIEDIAIRYHWVGATGEELRPSEFGWHPVGTVFNKAPVGVTGHDYVGYTLGASTMRIPGTPSIPVTTDSYRLHVTYHYQEAGQAVAMKRVSLDGTQLGSIVTHHPLAATTFTPTHDQTAFAGWELIDWKLDGEAAWRGNANPSITVPAGGATIILRYRQDPATNDSLVKEPSVSATTPSGRPPLPASQRQPSLPQTGDAAWMLLAALIAAAGLGGGLLASAARLKRHDDDPEPEA